MFRSEYEISYGDFEHSTDTDTITMNLHYTPKIFTWFPYSLTLTILDDHSHHKIKDHVWFAVTLQPKGAKWTQSIPAKLSSQHNTTQVFSFIRGLWLSSQVYLHMTLFKSQDIWSLIWKTSHTIAPLFGVGRHFELFLLFLLKWCS